jgi:hypothetical protein
MVGGWLSGWWVMSGNSEQRREGMGQLRAFLSWFIHDSPLELRHVCWLVRAAQHHKPIQSDREGLPLLLLLQQQQQQY